MNTFPNQAVKSFDSACYYVSHKTRKAFLVCYARLLGAVCATAGQLLSFACPKESNPRKRHPAYRPLRGYPALLAMPGGCAIRSFVPVWAQKVGVPLWETRTFRYAKPCSNKCSPTPPGMAVLLGAAQGPRRSTTVGHLRFVHQILIFKKIIKLPARGFQTRDPSADTTPSDASHLHLPLF